METITIELPAFLIHLVEMYCQVHGIEISELVEALLRDVLEEDSE